MYNVDARVAVSGGRNGCQVDPSHPSRKVRQPKPKSITALYLINLIFPTRYRHVSLRFACASFAATDAAADRV
jgi:hypothetical protein